MVDFDIPSEWDSLTTRIPDGATVALVGPIDSGKSTFCRYLVHKLREREAAVGFVDCDVGQSTLGPPCTVGAKMFSPRDASDEMPPLDDPTPPVLEFVGNTSPQGHLLQMLFSTKRAHDRVRQMGAETVVVDTTGLIAGGIGQALKFHKLMLLPIDIVVAFDHDGELSGLLSTFEGTRVAIERLSPSPAVRRKTADERRFRREEKFRAYFTKAETITLDLRAVPIRGLCFGRGEPQDEAVLTQVANALETRVYCAERAGRALSAAVALRPRSAEAAIAKHELGLTHLACVVPELLTRALVSLNDADGHCLALGIVETIDLAARRCVVRTPLREPGNVRSLTVGTLRLDSACRQLSGNPRVECY